MSRVLSLLLVLVLVTSSIAVVLPVKAESRTIVVPDDYPTISSAMENALAGDTVLVKKGTYQEQSLEINKSISLIAADSYQTIINLNPPLVKTGYLRNWIWIPASAITINANDVKLQGFAINLPDDDYGVGSGIYAKGDRLTFVNNEIANRSVYLQGSMLNITGNALPAALEVVGSNQVVAENLIRDNLKIQGSSNLIYGNKITSDYPFSGIRLNGSFNYIVGNSFPSMEIDDSKSNFIVDNSFGRLALWEFGHGGCSDSVISKNRVTGNGGVNDGIHLWLGSNNTFSANIIRNCQYGLSIGSKATQNSVNLNNFYNNTEQHVTCSNLTENRFDNGVKGNYYDDYKGTDGNGDGVGDSPYAIQEIHWDEELQREVTVVYFQGNYPLMNPFDIGSVSIQLPDWTSATLDSLSEPQTSEPFPITLILLSTITAALVGLGLFVFLRKFQRDKKP